MNVRKNEISIMNSLLCMNVIFIHLLSNSVYALTPNAPLYPFYISIQRLLSFAVQGFIFLSGMKTFLNGKKQNFGAFAFKRLKAIIFPYAVAVLLYYLYFVLVLKYFSFSISDYIKYLFNGTLAAHFYFVIVIVQFYALFPLWSFLLKRISAVTAISISAVITILLGLYSICWIDKITGSVNINFTDRLFTTYLVYWTLGIYAGLYYDKFISAIKKFSLPLCVFAVIAAAADCSTFVIHKLTLSSALHLDMIHAIYCVFMILATYSVVYRIREKINRLVLIIDKSSYYIFLIHVLIIFITDYIFARIGALPSVTGMLIIRSAIVYGIVILFAYVRGNVLGKNRKPSL